MTKIRTDAFGNEINVGDTVGFSGTNKTFLSLGKIEAFTEHYAKISFKSKNRYTGGSVILIRMKKYENITLIKTK